MKYNVQYWGIDQIILRFIIIVQPKKRTSQFYLYRLTSNHFQNILSDKIKMQKSIYATFVI